MDGGVGVIVMYREDGQQHQACGRVTMGSGDKTRGACESRSPGLSR